MKKALYIFIPASIIGLGYGGWQLANKKNAVSQITYSAKSPKFIDAFTDAQKNTIIKCTLELDITNPTGFKYGLHGLNINLMYNNATIAQINTNKTLTIAANRVTTHSFEILINLGSAFEQIKKLLAANEIVITVNGVANYSIMFTAYPVNFSFKFNLAETVLQVGGKTLIDLIYKTIFG